MKKINIVIPFLVILLLIATFVALHRDAHKNVQVNTLTVGLR